MPEVSIIIPVYNAEEFLAKCVMSALDQTISNIEVILVNDGSTDRSLQMCYEFSAKDKRVKVIDKQNEGVSEARNCGIEHASGTYLMFLDADDWLSHDALERCMPYTPEYDIVRFSSYAVHNDKLRKFKLGNKTQRRDIIGDIIARKTIVACWGAIIRKSLFIENGIRFDKSLNIGEDWLVTAQLTKNSNRIKLLPEVFCYYYNRTNAGSCTANMQREKILKQFEVYDRLRDMFPKVYESEFSFTKCLITKELIDNCGHDAAMHLLESRGKKINFSNVCSFALSTASLRKKAVLFKHWLSRKYNRNKI